MSNKGAKAMYAAAEKGNGAGKDALIDAIEKALPEDADPANAGRQLGAIITAVTMMYHDICQTIITSSATDPSGGQQEARLLAGHLKNMLAEPLGKIAQIADGTYRFEKERGANENG